MRTVNLADGWPFEDSPAKVVVPYVPGMLRPETVTAVTEQVDYATLFPIDAEDQTGYTRMFLALFGGHKDLVIIEQDIVPASGSIKGMLRCGYDWCTCPYPVSGVECVDALGCVRFSAALQQAFSTVIYQVAREHNGKGAPRTWRNLDQAVRALLTSKGLRPHHDHPAAAHLHDYESEGNDAARA